MNPINYRNRLYINIGDFTFPFTTRGGAVIPDYAAPFQYRQACTRNKVEPAFGILKKRWAKLRIPRRMSICNTINMIQAACVLHNMCIKLGIGLEEEAEDDLFGNHINPEGAYDTPSGSGLRDVMVQYCLLNF
eukprot:g14998.t1